MGIMENIKRQGFWTLYGNNVDGLKANEGISNLVGIDIIVIILLSM